jgi:hypothetical protein
MRRFNLGRLADHLASGNRTFPRPIIARADMWGGVGGSNPSRQLNPDRAPGHIFTSAKIENSGVLISIGLV